MLSLEKACSIGFRYGEYGGRKRNQHPAFLRACAVAIWSGFFSPFAVSRLIRATPNFGTVEALRGGFLLASPTPSSDVTGGTSVFTEYAAS
jgi:hypothetical protein